MLGEHRELHALWTILTTDKKGYRNHPETKRWIGKCAALYHRHDEQVAEMQRRGYIHVSPLDQTLATGGSMQDDFVNTIAEQVELLKRKSCACYMT